MTRSASNASDHTERAPRRPKPRGSFGATLFYWTAMMALLVIPILLFAMAAR